MNSLREAVFKRFGPQKFLKLKFGELASKCEHNPSLDTSCNIKPILYVTKGEEFFKYLFHKH